MVLVQQGCQRANNPECHSAVVAEQYSEIYKPVAPTYSSFPLGLQAFLINGCYLLRLIIVSGIAISNCWQE